MGPFAFSDLSPFLSFVLFQMTEDPVGTAISLTITFLLTGLIRCREPGFPGFIVGFYLVFISSSFSLAFVTLALHT